MDTTNTVQCSMNMTNTILGVCAVAGLLILACYVVALLIAMNSIFKGSGSPISMAQTVLSSIHVASQHLLGVLVITVVCVLMVKNIITSAAGLPLLSAVAGYLLAKTFKDVNISPSKRGKTGAEDE